MLIANSRDSNGGGGDDIVASLTFYHMVVIDNGYKKSVFGA